MTGYSCKACGAPADVGEEGIERTCAHTTTTVVADMSGTLYAQGSAGEAAPPMLRFLARLGVRAMEHIRGV